MSEPNKSKPEEQTKSVEQKTTENKKMSLACYILPKVPTPIIGVEYRYSPKDKPSKVLFWQPPYKHFPYQLWEWVPATSSWKVCSSKLSEKMEKKITDYWTNHTDIGLWVAHLKKLNNPQPAERTKRFVKAA